MSTRYSETSAEMLRIDPDDDPRTVGPGAAGMRLWAALAVAAIAVAGFGGVVAYGYLAYADRGELAPAPLVLADPKPVKVKPDDPGGMTVKHQDIDVFALGGKDGARPTRPMVENLLPLPEAPLPKPMPVPVQPVAVAPAAPNQGASADAAAPGVAAVQPAASRDPEPLVSTGPPPFPAPLPPPAAPSVRVAAALQPSVNPPGAQASGATPASSPAAAAAAAPRAAATAVPTGRYRIQVGAMRSEAEAREAWDKVRRKHADVVGNLDASYPRVQLPGKGEFIRVQVGPLPDAGAAREACARLSRGGTGCMVVPPS